MRIGVVRLKDWDCVLKKKAKREGLGDNDLILISNQHITSADGKVIIRDVFLTDEYIDKEEETLKGKFLFIHKSDLNYFTPDVNDETGEVEPEAREFILKHAESLQKLYKVSITSPSVMEAFELQNKLSARNMIAEMERLNLIKKYTSFWKIMSPTRKLIEYSIGKVLKQKDIQKMQPITKVLTDRDVMLGIGKPKQKVKAQTPEELEQQHKNLLKEVLEEQGIDGKEVSKDTFVKQKGVPEWKYEKQARAWMIKNPEHKAARSLEAAIAFIKNKKKKPLASGTGVDVKTQAGLSARKKEKDQRKFITSKEEKARRAKI